MFRRKRSHGEQVCTEHRFEKIPGSCLLPAQRVRWGPQASNADATPSPLRPRLNRSVLQRDSVFSPREHSRRCQERLKGRRLMFDQHPPGARQFLVPSASSKPPPHCRCSCLHFMSRRNKFREPVKDPSESTQLKTGESRIYSPKYVLTTYHVPDCPGCGVNKAKALLPHHFPLGLWFSTLAETLESPDSF